MVRTCDAEPFSTLTIFPSSRSAIRKLRSLSGMSPQGAARSEAISVARGSPREATPLELGLLDGALEGDAELAEVAQRYGFRTGRWRALQAVVSSSAPQAATNPKRLHRCLAGRCPPGSDLRVTTTVWPAYSRQISCPKIRRVQDLDRLWLADQLDLRDLRPAVGVEHQLAGTTNQGNGRGTAHGSDGLRRAVCVGGEPRRSGRRRPEPGETRPGPVA